MSFHWKTSSCITKCWLISQNNNPGGGGGVLSEFLGGDLPEGLEPFAITRASSADFYYPILD